MKEKIKIKHKGSLPNVNKTNDIISYNKEIDQFNINGQWLIPFHRTEINYKNEIRKIILEIDNIKNNIKNNKTYKNNFIYYIELNEISKKLKKLSIKI